jgi:hypothetical protein
LVAITWTPVLEEEMALLTVVLGRLLDAVVDRF